MRCPVCGSELVEVGYPDELGFQHYRCPNDCEFEPPLSWKMWNAFGYSVLILISVVFLVLMSPLIIADKISSMLRGVRG